jgi:subtilisin family serine protease
MSLVSLSRAALAAALVLGTVVTARAQQPAGAVPVIVVLSDNAPFAAFRGNYHADERMAADPDAWGYQDHGVVGAIQALEARHGFRADRAYSAAIRGFSGRLSPQQIAALQNESIVQYIEVDGEMAIVGQRPPRDNRKPGGGGGGGGGSTEVVPWGITRIGAAGKPSVTTVHAYVIDTGIDFAQADLNVVGSVNFAGGQSSDCNGHGTHVSGTIAAKHNNIDVVGVAAGAQLVSVKVLGCAGSGSTSGVIAGVDWVAANAVKPAVANMSLGGGASSALDTAVTNAAGSGVVFALAAGNSGADACNSSPARAGVNAGVITTAAIDSTDHEASWSNYGTCVDLWAPGVSILSTKLGGGTTTMSGTSMASPHVAGTAARYLALSTAATAADVEAGLKTDATLTAGTVSKDGRPIEVVNAGSY